MIKFFKYKKGFTLIELLVVISIIGLLSSITLGSLSIARTSSRDIKRISDLRQIKIALELYYLDNGYYPAAGACAPDFNCYAYSYDSTSWNALAVTLAPYISSLPVDPLNTACAPWNNGCYSYTYGNVGRVTYPNAYDLTAQLENPNSQYNCQSKSYKFYFDNRAWCPGYSPYLYEASP